MNTYLCQKILPTPKSNTLPSVKIMSQRLQNIKNHLTQDNKISSSEKLSILKDTKKPDDVVIVLANRSAITKGFKGGFNAVSYTHLTLPTN